MKDNTLQFVEEATKKLFILTVDDKGHITAVAERRSNESNYFQTPQEKRSEFRAWRTLNPCPFFLGALPAGYTLLEREGA